MTLSVQGVAGFCLAWFVLTGTCRADGGTIQFSAVNQGLQVSIFTDPGVPSAGPVDLSVLVQDAATRAAILDAELHASLTPETPAPPATSTWAPPLCAVTSTSNLQSFQLHHRGSQNLLYYSSLVQIPAGGKWRLEVDARRGDETVSVSGVLEVADEVAPWTSYWHLFLFPPLAIGLFAAVQSRRATRKASRAARPSTKGASSEIA
ncbi:MAG: hypothetical protein JOY92_15065 [Verrucomicrobia bacterium]|nr:hypothetical protein [Verrucomicrobiota bacterium]